MSVAFLIGNIPHKRCSSCEDIKIVEGNFYKNCCTEDGLQNVCNICKAKIHKNWKYALESGQFDRMIREQNGRCAICSEPLLDPVIDHDHKTETLRSVLCRKCNGLLGMARDKIKLLQRAIAYLRHWTKE